MGVGQCTAWARDLRLGLLRCWPGSCRQVCDQGGLRLRHLCPSASRPLLWLFLKRQCSERSSLSSSYSFFLSKNSEKGGTSARANDSWLHWRDRQEPRGSEGAGGAAVAHMVPSCHGWGCTTEGGLSSLLGSAPQTFRFGDPGLLIWSFLKIYLQYAVGF